MLRNQFWEILGMLLLFFIIIFVTLLIAITFALSFNDPTYQLYSGIYGSFIATIASIGAVWVAWKQLRKINSTSSATFIHELTKDFFTSNARRLMILIEYEALEFVESIDAQPYFRVNIDKINSMPEELLNKFNKRQIYTMWEIDDFLINPLTDVGTLQKKELLDFEMVFIGFGYYIRMISHYPAIEKYIEWQQNDPKVKKSKLPPTMSVAL